MARNRTKVTLTCTGPDRLTEYNEEINSKVRKECWKGVEKFKPLLKPCVTGNVFNRMCPYLEIKTYK